MTARPLPTLLAVLLALLASCGGSSDPAQLVSAGEKSLGTRDYSAAQASFESALEAIGSDTSHPSYTRARLGQIEARSTTDAAGAKDDLIALSRDPAMKGKISDKDFNRIAGLMGDAKEYAVAAELLGEGMAQYPDSEHLVKLRDRLGDEASKSDDPEALKALSGLGYVGD